MRGSQAGRDCTADFDMMHGLHNQRIVGMMAPYRIATLRPALCAYDSSERRKTMRAMLLLVDRLLEAANVLRADWNRFSILLPMLEVERPSLHRDMEVHSRFVGTTAAIIYRALAATVDTIPASADEAATSVLDAVCATVKAVATAAKPAMSEENIHRLIAADCKCAATARDGAIRVLAELESSRDMTAATILSRVVALLQEFAALLAQCQ